MFADFDGAYEDCLSGRTSAQVESQYDSAKFTVRWGSSASETYEWTMGVTFDRGRLVYTNCLLAVEVTSADGNVDSKIKCADGVSYFTLSDG